MKCVKCVARVIETIDHILFSAPDYLDALSKISGIDVRGTMTENMDEELSPEAQAAYESYLAKSISHDSPYTDAILIHNGESLCAAHFVSREGTKVT